LEDALDVAHAERAAREEIHDSQAGSIGESAEQQLGWGVHGISLIRMSG
jgi:hypothetical protein